MRRSKRRTFGILLAGLLSAGAARAGDADDMALTVAVRTMLTRDDRLSALGLGALAADGHVTVWGPVPSADLSTLAEVRVGQIRGVKTVTNEIHISPKSIAGVARKPAPKSTAGPDPVVLMPLPGLPLPWVRVEPEDERPRLPAFMKPEDARRTVAKETAAEIMAPGGLMPVNRTDLVEKIEAILDRNAKFDGITIVIQSGLVRVNGTLDDWSDFWALSDELSKLVGVKRVVVDKITIRPAR